MTARLELHASAVALGETCALIRGPSGAGKSALSIALVDEARVQGLYGALVADDRVFLELANGRLIARGAPGFEGLIESRGVGILRLPHEPAAIASLLVDLDALSVRPPRYPQEDSESIDFLGVRLPRLALDLAPGATYGARMTLRRLGIAPRECPAIGNFA
jgi:HPr kinase/phosphorylase